MLALIPARGGSKVIPKNIKILGNKPLLFWSIERSLESKNINTTLISSDSDEILTLVNKYYGSSVELQKRPAELASDESKTVDLLKYIAYQYKNFEQIVILQPTSPLRPSYLIDKMIQAHVSSGNDLTVSGYYSTDYPFGEHKNISRQNLTPLFYDDGSVYIFRYKTAITGDWIPKKWAIHKRLPIYD